MEIIETRLIELLGACRRFDGFLRGKPIWTRVTEKMLRPLRLQRHDYLFVDVDHSGTRFVATLMSLMPRDPERAPSWSKRRVVHGQEMQDSPYVPSRDARMWFERIPECTYLTQVKKHMLGGTDFTALLILTCWPKDRVVFQSDEARDLCNVLALQFKQQFGRAKAAAHFKENAIVPRWSVEARCWHDHARLPLSDYQRVAVELATGVSGYALFMDRGTGKTAVAVQRVCVEATMLRKKLLAPLEGKGQMLRALIVCPPQVRLNWQREVKRFATVPGKVVTVRGDKAKRIEQLTQGVVTESDCHFSAVIIGYESLAASMQHFALVPWDLIICDESHFFKDASTRRFAVLREVGRRAARRMIMTGSPIGNSPMDLWSQLEFLGQGMSGFTTFKAFKKYYGVYSKIDAARQQGVEKLIGLKNMPMLQERIARCSFSITKKEAGLNLPDIVFDVIEIELPAHHLKMYQKIQDELALEVEDILTKRTDQMTVRNVLTMLLRLSQVTSGHLVFDAVQDADMGAVRRPKRISEISVPNPKVEAILREIEDPDRDPKGKTIIWTNWVQNIQVLSKALTDAGHAHGCYYGATPEKERDGIVDRFNSDPTFKVLVCNPQTAGEGLNLIGYDPQRPDDVDTYCDHVIFMSSNWSSIMRAQAIDRAHRRGTRCQVRVTDLIVPGTIDEDILERVTEKLTMARVVGDVRQILKSVLHMEGVGV